MKLPESLLNEMSDLFLSYKRNKAEVESYFSEHRKAIKLLVDSAVEQIVEGVCAAKPRNSRHARLLLNNARNGNSIEAYLLEVCIALNLILEDYWVLESADYVEYEERIRHFLLGPLAGFCQSLARAPSLADSVPSLRLVASVRGIGNVQS